MARCRRPECANEASPKPKAMGLCKSCFVAFMQHQDRPGQCAFCHRKDGRIDKVTMIATTNRTQVDGAADLHVCERCFAKMKEHPSFRLGFL